MAIQTIERIEGPLDANTSMTAVSIVRRMSSKSDIEHWSHPDIGQELEGKDVLYVVRHPFGSVVALAGAVVEQDGRVMRLTEIGASVRADDDATHEMMHELVAYVRDQGAEELVLDVNPREGTAAADFVERYHIQPNQYGAYILPLANVELDELRG